MNLSINLKNFELDLGTKKITIKDRFTLILGKFKPDLFQKYQNQEFKQIIEKLDLIPANIIIDYIQNQSEELKGLQNSLKILDYLKNYRKIVEYNLDIFTKFNGVIENIILIFRHILLSERKNQLETELELAIKHKKSSELSAIVDLINKLKESIKNSQMKLNYIKEDYFQRKRQIDQIQGNIALFEKNILELNQIKKTCFSHINRITRQIEEATSNQDNISLSKLGIDNNLTNAEKIRALQKKAKESQYEINQIKLKSKQVKDELEEKTPQFNIYKKDYEEILDSIKEDEARIKTLQSEYEKELNLNQESQVEEIKDLLETTVRPSLEIENEISSINSELEGILIPSDLSNDDDSEKLRVLLEKLREIDDILRNNDNKVNIPKNEEEISRIFENFNSFENLLKYLEGILNLFLKEINLTMKFLLAINNSDTSFFIEINFIRNEKEKANFQTLTTPEKIFFIVSFFISTGVLLGHDDIFFSNLFIPSIYNKAGSIYRTIRRILPLFETKTKLKKYNLIFLMSNLELKKVISNIKIVKV